MNQQYIHSLTPLRGIAALMVVVYHYQVLIRPLVGVEQSALINKWYLMVDFFFILSGFIITHAYSRYFQEGITWDRFKRFMLARFARLYPLHILSLLFMICLFLFVKDSPIFENLPTFLRLTLDTDAILSNVLLIQTAGIFPEPTWNSPSWSISVEWWTYTLFPFLVILFNKNKRWFNIGAVLFILIAYASIMFYFQPSQFAERQAYMELISEFPNTLDVMVGSSFLRCMAGFILGMLVYQAFLKQVAEKQFSNSWKFFVLLAILFLGWHWDVLPDAIAALLFAPLILLTIYNKGILKNILNIPALQKLGDISYSLYMIHFPLIFCYHLLRSFLKTYHGDSISTISGAPVTDVSIYSIESVLVSIIGLLLFIVVSVGIAYLTHRYFEDPMRLFLKKQLTPPKPISIKVQTSKKVNPPQKKEQEAI